MLFPKSSATMTDVWQVMGLQRHRQRQLFGARSVRSGGLQLSPASSPPIGARPGRSTASPSSTCSGSPFRAVALGIARKVLDDFIKLAKEKVPFTSTALLRDNGLIQSQVGLSEARLQALRAPMCSTAFRQLYAHARRRRAASPTSSASTTAASPPTPSTRRARWSISPIMPPARPRSSKAIRSSGAFATCNTVTQQGQAPLFQFRSAGPDAARHPAVAANMSFIGRTRT